MAPQPEAGGPIPSGPPEEISRGGKRYYLPTTVGQIADRMLEIYGADGLREIWDAIQKERETSEWIYLYHNYALYGDDGSVQPPSLELEHMSVHSGPSELELYSEFYNIPLDLLMSYANVPEDRDEMDWEALNEEILWPLFYDIVPRAWEILLPGLPGKIIQDSSDDDGCPALKYVETPPEGFRTDLETLERLEREMKAPYNRPRSPEMAPTESFERVESEEPEEEAEEEPPPKKKKKKKK